MRRNDSFCKEGQSVGGKSKSNRDSQTSLKTSVIRRQSQKLAMARWKLAQLEANQLLLDKQHKLKTKMREKEFKTEMARLQMKKEIDAQEKVGMCALESQYSHVDDDELEKKSLQSLNIESRLFIRRWSNFSVQNFLSTVVIMNQNHKSWTKFWSAKSQKLLIWTKMSELSVMQLKNGKHKTLVAISISSLNCTES